MFLIRNLHNCDFTQMQNILTYSSKKKKKKKNDIVNKLMKQLFPSKIGQGSEEETLAIDHSDSSAISFKNELNSTFQKKHKP